MNTFLHRLPAAGMLTAMLLVSCKPTVKVEAPEKPIVINMNIKIDHEIRVRVDRELEDLLDSKQGLF
ncbi:YnbE family lipoprotein [Prosthecochloris sp. N3]|uniref:YnbE family lipoprotein n=2 Tax=Chlorobiaceae TaxID=191412 RepID=A0ABR9XUB8_9CHLB|nr:YnbE family lipoprotein [Prosthecochloris ethylica]MBF0637477.1 YnbE family lipoprotein [Prosthecochloris ethylica]NUK48517.1 YnbE family lipoprotein [Prosthecochloris ethylica]RNA66110.1 YnbE family lipoprotein [Prosthecochloris sp. ZM_2]